MPISYSSGQFMSSYSKKGTTYSSLVKHNGLILAEPSGPGFTVFSLNREAYYSLDTIKIRLKGGVTKTVSAQEVGKYQLGTGEVYDFGGYLSTRDFEESATAVGRLIGATKDIIYQATRGESKVLILGGLKDDKLKDIVLSLCKSYGIYLESVDQEMLSPGGKNESGMNFGSILTNHLQKQTYKNVRLFSQEKEQLHLFLDLGEVFPQIGFEGYYLQGNGSIVLMTRRPQ
jgi:hypothetical protein